MATVEINGKKYSGRDITIVNDKVYIDGKLEQESLTGILSVRVTGDLASLSSDSSVTVQGNVDGNVQAGGSINCENVSGSVRAGGSVNCGNVDGEVICGGSVNTRKK